MNKVNTYDEKIISLYVDEKKTMKEVATLCGIAVGKVYNRLKANGVQTRSVGDYPTSQKVIETARRTGLARKGRKQTDETKKKMSEAKFRGGIGHKKKRSDGYVSVYMPEHPHASNDGYVMEHDLVMECAIGRWLSDDEIVHHKNENKSDNRLCNLQLMTKSEHMSLHSKERYKEGKMKHKTMAVINTTTGERFSSVKDAADAYKVSASLISRACRRKGTSIKKCAWKYERSDDLLTR